MRILHLCLWALIGNTLAAEEPQLIGAFSTGHLEQWEPHKFQQLTDYQLVTDSTGQRVLKAYSQGSASGLYNKQRIDLDKTPFINWRWKIANYLTPQVQEKTKSGDDYAARIYVVLDGGLRFWNTKSINYVWASNLPKYSIWSNAYAGNSVKMLALRAREDRTNTWYTEKRNVREDFKKLLGQDVHAIDAVALMTDTDNSKQTATAYYGDIYFSAD